MGLRDCTSLTEFWAQMVLLLLSAQGDDVTCDWLEGRLWRSCSPFLSIEICPRHPHRQGLLQFCSAAQSLASVTSGHFMCCAGARKAEDAEDEGSMVVQVVWSDGHKQWLPTSKLQEYHHCCRSLVSFYESRARSRRVPKSNA